MHICDVQIIAATSRNLPTMIRNGEFREDLYCRLAVLTVETTPLRERREDIPAMIALFLREAADVVANSSNEREAYCVEAEALKILCEFDYPGNIGALRNLIYELTSFVEDNEPISTELIQFALGRLSFRGVNPITPKSDDTSSLQRSVNPVSVGFAESTASSVQQSLLRSLAREGDIILPLELCVLSRGESFKQWSSRAKRCSIEAARQATGDMQSAAERLGLTCYSLKGHL